MKQVVTLPLYNTDGFKTNVTRDYFVNGYMPDELKNKRIKGFNSESVFADRNARFYNHKHTKGDSSIIAQLRDFYTGLKQPSEARVRVAMIWVFDEDYAIKSGGETASDTCYSSSLCIWISDEITFEDKKVVLLKKYSKNFHEVLITLNEIEDLFNSCLSETEKQGVLLDEARSIAGELARAEQGFTSMFANGVDKVMPMDFRKKLIAKAIKDGITLPMFKEQINTFIDWITPDLDACIIEDNPMVNKTLENRQRAQNRIEAFGRVNKFIEAEFYGS